MSAATIVGMLALLVPVALLTSVTLSPPSSSSSLAELNQTDVEMMLAYNNAVVGIFIIKEPLKVVIPI
jgi:hypothetical protein